MDIFTFEIKAVGVIEGLKVLRDFIKKLSIGKYTIFLSKGWKRSNEQNRMYRAILNGLAEYSGYDQEELHDICKNKFLSHTHQSEMFGELIIVKSTKDLTTKQFSEYVDKVANFSAERGVVVQDQSLQHNLS